MGLLEEIHEALEFINTRGIQIEQLLRTADLLHSGVAWNCVPDECDPSSPEEVLYLLYPNSFSVKHLFNCSIIIPNIKYYSFSRSTQQWEYMYGHTRCPTLNRTVRHHLIKVIFELWNDLQNYWINKQKIPLVLTSMYASNYLKEQRRHSSCLITFMLRKTLFINKNYFYRSFYWTLSKANADNKMLKE